MYLRRIRTRGPRLDAHGAIYYAGSAFVRTTAPSCGRDGSVWEVACELARWVSVRKKQRSPALVRWRRRVARCGAWPASGAPGVRLVAAEPAGRMADVRT